jgi:hypothetical protein
MRTEIPIPSREPEATPVGMCALPMKKDPPLKSRVVLQTWKQIAAELDRGVRTVQRWERTLALPVHRLGNNPRGPVFAFQDELQTWLHNQLGGNFGTISASRYPVDGANEGSDGARESDDAHRPNGQPSKPRKKGRDASDPKKYRLVKSRSRVLRMLQLLHNFFAAFEQRPGRRDCVRCRRPMQFLEGHFRLDGTDMSWKLAMPICFHCDSEETLEYLAKTGKIH